MTPTTDIGIRRTANSHTVESDKWLCSRHIHRRKKVHLQTHVTSLFDWRANGAEPQIRKQWTDPNSNPLCLSVLLLLWLFANNKHSFAPKIRCVKMQRRKCVSDCLVSTWRWILFWHLPTTKRTSRRCLFVLAKRRCRSRFPLTYSNAMFLSKYIFSVTFSLCSWRRLKAASIDLLCLYLPNNKSGRYLHLIKIQKQQFVLLFRSKSSIDANCSKILRQYMEKLLNSHISMLRKP